MVKDAEAHSAEDKKKRERVEARNTLDSMIFTVERTIKENEAKVPADLKTNVEASLKAAKEKLESAELDELKTLRDDLEKHAHKIAEIVYQQANANKANGGGGTPPGGDQGPGTQEKAKDPNVVDAEFEDEQPNA